MCGGLCLSSGFGSLWVVSVDKLGALNLFCWS